jgi:hypothetical protein
MEQINIYDWIKKIIETCNNSFHFEGVDRLIELYLEKFQDEMSTDTLRLLRQNKWNQIHDILV